MPFGQARSCLPREEDQMLRRWTIRVSLTNRGEVDLIWIERWHEGEVVRAWSLDWPQDRNVMSAFATALHTLDFQDTLW